MPIDASKHTPLGAPARPVPMSGETAIRVRYCECDPMRVAHHASYAPWLEIARTELLREAGASYAAMEASGVFLVVTKLEIRYRRAIRYDDLIGVRVRVEAAGAIRLRHHYELVLMERDGGKPDPADPGTPADGVCAVAMTELACVDGSGRPRALPGWLGGSEA